LEHKKFLPYLLVFIVTTAMISPLNPAASSLNGAKATFNHIVLVTYDGARKYWVDALMDNGTLANLASLRSDGVEITLRITDHRPSTDPGMACMESGYGADITGIDMNYFASDLNPSIPDGLTTTERIKAVYGAAWKTALVMPWTQESVNVTNTRDSTFWNQREETDYWFSSENVTWSASDPAVWKNALSFYDALLRANYTAYKVAEFIRSNSESNFYVRAHFVEPDYAGHVYRESVDSKISPQYKQGLIECDEALGLIIDALKDTGIFNETVILVSTDHGFKGLGHGPPAYPLGEPDVTETWLVSSDPEVTNELGWGLQNDISPTCLGLAGIDPSAFQPFYNETSRALPLWEANLNNREMTCPSVSDVSYPESVYEGEDFNITVKISDESGISVAQIRYLYGTIWRTRSLTQANETLYHGSLGPFVEGTEVRWYLQVVDNSTSLNMAYYPENKTALTYTVQEGIAVETSPPTIVNVEYSEHVLVGDAFTVSAQVQDESGIASVEIYYSSNSDWYVKDLTETSDSLYEGSIGPFDAGTEVRWYLKATDNSTNRNTAFHPPDEQPLVFIVEAGAEQGVPIEFLLVGGVIAIFVVAVMIYWFKSR
jgi:hypothetical protein